MGDAGSYGCSLVDDYLVNFHYGPPMRVVGLHFAQFIILIFLFLNC